MFCPKTDIHLLKIFFFQFVEGDLVDALFWETWYNKGYRRATVLCPDGEVAKKPCKVPPADRNVMYENRILGLPRIRMVSQLQTLKVNLVN